MPDVAKLKKRALDFEQKKQFDKALDTYTLVLAQLDEHVEEADIALYNRVGDLLLRRGDVSDAVDHYEKAVDLYTEGGFFNNAIALCNKILRSAPGRSSVYYKLGKISAHKGFVNDAKQNFLEYADRMQRAGNLEEAFRALKEFADLCPDQDDIRLMLADQLVRKDRKSEAIEQLQALYEKFSVEGRTTEARATVDRMKALDPALEPREAVHAPVTKRTDLIFLDVNYDEPTRPPAPTGSSPVIDDIPWIVEPAATLAATPVVDVELPDVELPLVDVELPDVELPLVDVELPDVQLPLVDVEENILADSEGQASEIVPLSGLSHGAFVQDDASLASDEIVSHVDLGFITGFENSEVDGAADAHADVAPLAELESNAPEGFEVEHSEPAEIVLPPIAEDLPIGGELPMLDMSLGDEDDPMGMGGALAYVSLEPLPEAPVPLDPGVERSPSLEMDAVVPDGGPPLPLLDIEEPAAMYQDSAIVLPEVEPEDAPVDPERAVAGLPLLDPESTEPASAAPPADDEDEEEQTVELVWQAEPADLPIAAAPTGIDLLRREVANHPASWDLHRQLAEALLEKGLRAEGMVELEASMFGYEHEGNLGAASRIAEELIRVEPNSVRYHQKRVEYAVRANDKLQLVDAYLALAESLFRSGQLDKSRAVYGRVLELSPADARAVSALRELGVELAPPAAPQPRVAPTASQPEEGFVNLSDWLHDEEPPARIRKIADARGGPPDEQGDFDEMLSRFKQGVTANVEDTDHESHYDLGIAYKEMGLLDEAISEFQKALRGTGRRVRTYEALGQCFVEKRQYEIALTMLARALSDGSAGDDVLVGVLYLLGYASESLQRWEDAMGYYERVFTVDIQFRDIGDRLATVERKLR
jgi:tetratricopeptide (TPR) repeat protein